MPQRMTVLSAGQKSPRQTQQQHTWDSHPALKANSLNIHCAKKHIPFSILNISLPVSHPQLSYWRRHQTSLLLGMQSCCKSVMCLTLVNDRSPSFAFLGVLHLFQLFPRFLKAGCRLHSSFCIQISPIDGEKSSALQPGKEIKAATKANFFLLGVVLSWDTARDARKSEALMTLAELLHESLLPSHTLTIPSQSLSGCLQVRQHFNSSPPYPKKSFFGGFFLKHVVKMWHNTSKLRIKAPSYFLEICFLAPSHAKLQDLSDCCLNHFLQY